MEKNFPLPMEILMGDPIESFHQLGIKDQKSFRDVQGHLKSVLQTDSSLGNLAIHQLFKRQGMRLLKGKRSFQKMLRAYGEGLQVKNEDLVIGLLLPEVISTLSHWIPGVPYFLWGCSSYFLWDEEKESPIHGRILDFPLVTTYDKYERAMISRHPGGNQIFSLGCGGMPFSSLTAMNQSGVTLAIHQKFSKSFYTKGSSIFEIAHNFINQVDSKKEAIQFLKNQTSMATWGIYASFSNGEILAADLSGEESITREFDLKKEKYLYFNNQLLDFNINQKQFSPFGVDQYNQMRFTVAQQKLQNLKNKDQSNAKDLIKLMSLPLNQKDTPPEKWNLDPLTPSSLVVTTLEPKEGKCLYIPGVAPKMLGSNLIEFSDVWDRANSKEIAAPKVPLLSKSFPKYKDGIREWMRAQVCFDKNDIHGAYHHIQLAKDELQDWPEGTLAKFYFLVFEFLFDSHSKTRSRILEGFKELEGQLPPHLNEHRLLFVSRCERLLDLPSQISGEDFATPQLKRLYKWEQKLNPKILYYLLRNFTSPRIDLIDLVYGHENLKGKIGILTIGKEALEKILGPLKRKLPFKIQL